MTSKYRKQPTSRIGKDYQGTLLQPMLAAMDEELLRLRERVDEINSTVPAPYDAPFVTIGSVGDLLAERALTGTATRLSVTDNGANSTVVLDVVSTALLDANVHSDTVAQAVSRGSLIYGNSMPKWDELTIGGASTLLRSDGTDPSWGTVNLLSAFHGDTTAGTVVRGDLVTGQTATPKWQRLALGASGTLLRSDGTDAAWTSVVSAIGHPILDGSIHTDSVAQGVTRGSIIYGNATPKWDELVIGTATQFLKSDGTDVAWTSGAALSRTDDTNVTLTLGGSATTALVNAASLTLGWTGQLSLTRGGTNKSLTASAGGIVWTDADSMEVLAGTATAGQILRSGASVTPSWSTATYPATAGTSGNFLASDGTNWASTTLTAAMLPSHDHSSSTTGGSLLRPVSTGTGTVPLIVKGFAGQTAALTQWQDSGSGVLAHITAAGGMVLLDDLEIGGGGGSVVLDASAATATRLQQFTNADGTIPLLEAIQTWTALQTFRDNTFIIVGSASSNRTLKFEVDSASANADLILNWAGTADRTLTFPNVTSTLAALGLAQTFTATQTINIDATSVPQLTLNDSNSGFQVDLYASPSADRTISFPNADGTLAIAGGAREAAKTSNVATTTLITAPPIGNYVISYTLECTTSAVGAGSVAITFGWTDGAGAATKVTTGRILTATGRLTDNNTFSVNPSSGDITYKIDVTGIYSTSQYAYSISVVQVTL